MLMFLVDKFVMHIITLFLHTCHDHTCICYDVCGVRVWGMCVLDDAELLVCSGTVTARLDCVGVYLCCATSLGKKRK
jgi:hypothetical protein